MTPRERIETIDAVTRQPVLLSLGTYQDRRMLAVFVGRRSVPYLLDADAVTRALLMDYGWPDD